jgi:hypothetical protein
VFVPVITHFCPMLLQRTAPSRPLPVCAFARLCCSLQALTMHSVPFHFTHCSPALPRVSCSSYSLSLYLHRAHLIVGSVCAPSIVRFSRNLSLRSLSTCGVRHTFSMSHLSCYNGLRLELFLQVRTNHHETENRNRSSVSVRQARVWSGCGGAVGRGLQRGLKRGWERTGLAGTTAQCAVSSIKYRLRCLY